MKNTLSWNDVPLRIFQAHRTYCDPNWRWEHFRRNDAMFNLWLVTEGRGTMRVAGQEYPLRSGDCFLFRQWEPNEGRGDPKYPLVVPYIQFHCLDRRGRPLPALSAAADLPPRYRRILHMGFFDALLQRAIDAQQAGQSQAAVHWLRTAVLEMIRQDALPASTDLQREQLAMVDRMVQEILRRPADFGNVGALAERAGYSKDHFIRLFHRYKGVTPGEFVIQARIQSAGELLRFSNHSISRIAEMLGYGDIYAFSKQFRRRTGQSPSTYRNARRSTCSAALKRF
ncbi:MAG: helix-turn-helix domain-containing protein, partial [Phycisphaerae bacterium]|nr:helix-turn-helix domain-containing protein [Phycisphaerae bacterium]